MPSSCVGTLAALLRPGSAGSNTAADHITTAQLALAHLSKASRWGRRSAPSPHCRGMYPAFPIVFHAGEPCASAGSCDVVTGHVQMLITPSTQHITTADCFPEWETLWVMV